MLRVRVYGTCVEAIDLHPASSGATTCYMGILLPTT
jgi:hypothetical protein